MHLPNRHETELKTGREPHLAVGESFGSHQPFSERTVLFMPGLAQAAL